MNRRTFETKCKHVAEELDLGDPFFFEDASGADECEDDGTLHITRCGVRACFGVSNGQNDSGQVQNTKSRAVLDALGIKQTPEVLKRCLVEEIDEEDEECPHCGRSGCTDY